MKKFSMLRNVAAALILAAGAEAQVISPADWADFVKSNNNVLVPDTFRYQSFSNLEKDNWNYSASTGEPQLLDISGMSIQNTTSPYALQLFPGDSVSFEAYSLSIYENVVIYCPFAMRNINTDERFYVSATVPGGTDKVDQIYSIVPEDGFNSYFNERLTLGNVSGGVSSEYSSIRAGYGCSDIRIKIGGTKRGDDSYYLLDHICASGDIPSYSLFEGTGFWGDTAKWTHLPAFRHRHALIQGDVTVENATVCDYISFSDGNIRFSSGATLETKSFTYYKTFEEKGSWYFVSFPFDVYAGDVSPEFSQGDDQTTGSGNYFYVKTYDGKSRAGGGTSNWKTKPVVSSGEILFRKGEGYLVALDAEATQQTLYVYSRSGETLEFSPSATLFISGEDSQGAKTEDSGWILCGNPLPCGLKLSDIESKGDTDGYVYVYNGESYEAYEIGGNYELPVGSAFFLKVSGDTELSILSSSSSAAKQLQIPAMSKSYLSEPAEIPTALEEIGTEDYRIAGGRLYFPSSDNRREVAVYDFSGRIRSCYSLPAYAGSVELPQQSGIYYINVMDNGSRKVWGTKWSRR